MDGRLKDATARTDLGAPVPEIEIVSEWLEQKFVYHKLTSSF